MTFGEMQTRVRRKLNETIAAFWTNQDVKDAINEGYQELADATEFFEREAMIPMIAGHTYYDLEHILSDTFLSPRRAYNPRTSRWLEPTDPLELDRSSIPQWDLTSGEPEKHWMRGNWWYGVFPKPIADSVGIRFYYTSIPEAMSASGDQPKDLPAEFHDAIVEYALSDLLGQKRETQKALGHWQQYQGFEARLKQYVEGRTRLAGVPII